jgi:tetratricopeptide (TPR) repeat protein
MASSKHRVVGSSRTGTRLVAALALASGVAAEIATLPFGRAAEGLGVSRATAQPMIAPPAPVLPRTPAQEAARLQRRGDVDGALALLDKRIAEAPRDTQARFLRGVILTDLKRTAEAAEVFAALTREFPDLPEPYNNLAVLHAAAGRYDEARRALEQSLLANPLNAVARQNLGDVHVQLAREAYERALAQEPRDRALRAKLALIGELAKLPAGAPASPAPSQATSPAANENGATGK